MSCGSAINYQSFKERLAPLPLSAHRFRDSWQMWSGFLSVSFNQPPSFRFPENSPLPVTFVLLSHFCSAFRLELSPFRFGSAKVSATFSFSNSFNRNFLPNRTSIHPGLPPEPLVKRAPKLPPQTISSNFYATIFSTFCRLNSTHSFIPFLAPLAQFYPG